MPDALLVLPVPPVINPLSLPDDPWWSEWKRMQEESWRLVQKTLAETGHLPKWELYMRDPKFAAAVAAEADRILGEASEEIARRRATEYGILLGLEAEREAKQKALARTRINAEPTGLSGLRREVESEQTTGVTYGKSAEYRANVKHWSKGKSRGDRLVIVGTISGRDLKAALESLDAQADVSQIEDEKTYGGDLLIIGLEHRSTEEWLKKQRLWGERESGIVTKTVQMKWGETADPAQTLKMVTYAGVQLTGQRDERPVPGGLRIISIGVLNRNHPWARFDGTSAAMLPSLLESAFVGGNTNGYAVPREGLYSFVDRIVIRTWNWTFRFRVEGERIHFASATYAPDQLADLMAEPRPAKDVSGDRTGRLIVDGKSGKVFIQKTDNKPGQAKFTLTSQPLGITPGSAVTFSVDQKGNVSNVRKA